MKKNNLTIIILTKNEEKNLPAALDSVKDIAQRIVIVDCFSTDATLEIAKKYNCDVYQNPWTNHAAQLNWGLENTNIKTEWVFRLDADEIVTPELQKWIKKELNEVNVEINGIMIRRRIYFLGKWIKHGGIYPNYVLRIFRNKKAHCEQKIMDEHIIIESGKSIYVNADIIDDNKKSIEWWTNKHNWYSDRECYEVLNLNNLKEKETLIKPDFFGSFTEKKRWLKEKIYLKLPLGSRAYLYYIYRYYFKLGFLDGTEGKIYHFLQAYWYRFLVDAKLYEYQKNKTEEE